MRVFNKVVQDYPTAPDTVLSLQLTANSAQTFAYPVTAQLVRVSVGSSVAGQGVAWFNPNSSGVALPTTSATISTASTNHNIPVTAGGERYRCQRSMGSSNFSLIAPTSVQVCIEFWGRGNSTST